MGTNCHRRGTGNDPMSLGWADRQNGWTPNDDKQSPHFLVWSYAISPFDGGDQDVTTVERGGFTNNEGQIHEEKKKRRRRDHRGSVTVR